MQTVDAFSQQIFHPGHIITQTVVCGVGDNRMHRLRVNTVFNQRIFTNGFRDCGLSQTIRMYRADNAVLVARRNQICRNGARHRNCVFYLLMTVAVAQGNLIAGYAGHQNHPVGSRRTVGNRITAVCSENPRNIFFAFPYRSRMVQQRTKFAH